MNTPKMINQIDFPEEFTKISPDQKEVVINWIGVNIDPRKRANNRHTSYGIKHLFEHDEVGFYMTNGEFKGAMMACGYEPIDRTDLNWTYRISEKSPAFNRGMLDG